MRYVSFSLACCAGIACAEVAAPRLDGPEVALVSWDSGGSTPVDVDGDGRLDLALINNENSRLVILYQRNKGDAKAGGPRVISRNRWEPVIEDSRFEKSSLPADQRHFAMAAADFDGDGKVDFALTGGTDALLVRFQGKDATFTASWKYRGFEPLNTSSSLVAADLDGDRKADLAVLAKDKLLIFRQKPEGGLAEPVVYNTGEEKAGLLKVEEADGDGIPDLFYMVGEGEGSLRLRRGAGKAAFGSEVAIPFALPLSELGTSRDAAGRLIFTGVNARSQLIERHALVTGADPLAGDRLVPTVYTAPGAGKGALFTAGDFNGDGLADIAQADAKAAQVVLYSQREDGSFAEPQTFPSLSGINGLAAIPGAAGQPAALAVTSQKEGLGISVLNAQGRLEFPVLQALTGAPVLVTVAAPDPAQAASAGVISSTGKDYTLTIFSRSAEGKWTSTPQALKALKRDPSGTRQGDINGDGRMDLLITAGKDPALLLMAKPDAVGYQEALAETATIKSQLTEAAPDRLSLVDLDGDKRDEILTSGSGYARALKLNPAGNDIAIMDQYNARQPDDKLSTPLFADVDGDGASDLVFTESGGSWIQVLRRDAGGVYRAFRRIETGASEVSELQFLKLGRKAVPHLLLLGKDRFWTAPLAGSGPRMELTSSYETDIKDCRYYMALPGDLNGDGKEDITAFDGKAHLLEVMALPEVAGQPWLSLLHFPLFEENIHFRGRKGNLNVRDAFVRDFTGDGKSDLLLLLHDRVLLYPQAP